MALTANIQRAFVEGGAKTVMSRGIRRIVRPAFKMGSLVFTECDLSQPIRERQPVPESLLVKRPSKMPGYLKIALCFWSVSIKGTVVSWGSKKALES